MTTNATVDNVSNATKPRRVQGTEAIGTKSTFGIDSNKDIGDTKNVLLAPAVKVPALASLWHIRLFERENLDFPLDSTPPGGVQSFPLCRAFAKASLVRHDSEHFSIMWRLSRALPQSFENILRVEVVSSARAPAQITCPATSIWDDRPPEVEEQGHFTNESKGLPNGTVCKASERLPEPPYRQEARQHHSSIMFMLPFQVMPAEPTYAIEFSFNRTYPPQLAATSLSVDEASAELVNMYIEHQAVCWEGFSTALPRSPQDGSNPQPNPLVADQGEVCSSVITG